MEFDLEAAKRGDPIECLEAYGWLEVKFIGPWDAGSVVCAVDWSYKPEVVLMSKLRMAKKREVVRYRICLKEGSNNHYCWLVNSEDDSKNTEHDLNFIQWITDWQEYEIGANDGQV